LITLSSGANHPAIAKARYPVQFDDGVDVLEQAYQRRAGSTLRTVPLSASEAGVFAEDGDVAGLDDAMHHLMDDGAFAGTLWAVEQVAAAMQIAVFLEGVAQRPEIIDLLRICEGRLSAKSIRSSTCKSLESSCGSPYWFNMQP